MKAGSRLIDAHAVGQMIGQSTYTVRKKARQGQIPSIRMGVLIRFDRDEIEKWIAELPRSA
jgi:excisionase family DNA binding protein